MEVDEEIGGGSKGNREEQPKKVDPRGTISSARKKRFLLLFIVGLFLATAAGIAIGVAFALTTKSNPSDDDKAESASSFSDPSTTPVPSTPAPPTPDPSAPAPSTPPPRTTAASTPAPSTPPSTATGGLATDVNNETRKPSVSELTFQKGGSRTQDSRIEASPSRPQDLFKVEYDLQVTSVGIVSLDSIANHVETIECSAVDGTVHIQLASSIQESFADTGGMPTVWEMYPVGSILIINSGLFRACDVGEEDQDDGATQDEPPDFDHFAVHATRQSQDFFFRINSISGDVLDVSIQGTPVAYVTLFDQASIAINKLPPSETRQLLTAEVDSDSFSLESNVISWALLDVVARGTVRDKGEFVGFTATWDQNGINLEYKTIDETEFILDLTATLRAGVATPGFKIWEPWKAIPIYALPEIDFFAKDGSKEITEKEEEKPRFKIPKFKIGLYFEVPLILQIKAEVEKQLGNQATLYYNSGQKSVTYYMRGSFLDLDVGAETKVISNSTRNFTFSPQVTSFDEDPWQLNFEFFVGVRPMLALEVILFQARLSLDYGVGLAGKLALGNDAFFAALPDRGDKDVRGTVFGSCDTCHALELAAFGDVRNAGIFMTLKAGPKIRLLWFYADVYKKELFRLTLPGNPTWRRILATACFWEPDAGDETTDCSAILELPDDVGIGGGASDPYDEGECAAACQAIRDCQAGCGSGFTATFCMENCSYNPSYVSCASKCEGI